MLHKTTLRFDHSRLLSTFEDFYKGDVAHQKTQWMVVGHEDQDISNGTGRYSDMSIQESDFNYLLDQYRGTYVEEVYNELTEHLNVFRVRFMMLYPKRTYSYHRDPSPRFHIPITPNEHSWMIVDKNIFEFDAGWTYLVDTTLPHTAINMGEQPRLHIVGGYEVKQGI